MTKPVHHRPVNFKAYVIKADAGDKAHPPKETARQEQYRLELMPMLLPIPGSTISPAKTETL